MATTVLLPPVTGVRLAWALTGAFSSDEQSKQAALLSDLALKDMGDRAKSIPQEDQYVSSAIATINASRRSLEIVYKGRQLNFEENEKLRSAYLDSVKESLAFGEKAKDFLKSLPSMTIGAAGGVTVAQQLNLDGAELWAVGLFLAAAGYLVNLWFVRRAREKTQKLYITQDYERSLYYDQYLARVSLILTTLYMDLDRIHGNIFGDSYPIEPLDVKTVVEDTIKGVRPTFCWLVHEHIRSGKVTPERWSYCENGSLEAVQKCPLWKKRPATETSA